MKKLLCLPLLLIGGCLAAPAPVGAESDSDRYIRQIEDEITRRHEVLMAEKKIEILARLKEFGAPKNYFSSSSNVLTKMEVSNDTSIRQQS